MLAFADINKLILLETDTSSDGLGAILSQVQEVLPGGMWKLSPIKAGIFWPWTVIEHFQEYLQHKTTTVQELPEEIQAYWTFREEMTVEDFYSVLTTK